MTATAAERQQRYLARKRLGLVVPKPAKPKPVLALVSALGPIPRLDGAACAGRPRLFDERDTSAEPPEPEHAARERHREALAICQRCPALEQCRAWVASLRARDVPPGVTAGTIR